MWGKCVAESKLRRSFLAPETALRLVKDKKPNPNPKMTQKVLCLLKTVQGHGNSDELLSGDCGDNRNSIYIITIEKLKKLKKKEERKKEQEEEEEMVLSVVGDEF